MKKSEEKFGGLGEMGVSLQRQTKTTYQIQFYALKCMPRVYFYCGLLTTNKKRLHLKSLNTIWYCLGRRREMRCQPFSIVSIHT